MKRRVVLVAVLMLAGWGCASAPRPSPSTAVALPRSTVAEADAFLAARPTAAVVKAPEPLDVGQKYSVSFSPSTSVVPDGVQLVYALYVDSSLYKSGTLGTAFPAPVSGTVVVPMEPFTAASVGARAIRVGVRWVVTDPAKFACAPASVTGTVQSIDCGEAPVTVDVLVTDPTAPPPPPPVTSCPTTVPTGAFLGCYYNGTSFQTFVGTRNDLVINFDWGSAAPLTGLNVDNTSIRWEGDFPFEAASYDFSATTDDGVRLFVDGTVLIDKWLNRAPTTDVVRKALTAGTHRIKVEYYEATYGAVAKVSWAKVVVPVPVPVDCVVSVWSAWSAWTAWAPISATQEQRTQMRTRTITTQPANGGAACPALSETNTETRAITVVPAVTASLSTYQCRVVLTAMAPDATTGWSAQFRRQTEGSTTLTNISTPDVSAPYTRTTTVSVGRYAVTVLWGKTGQANVTSQPLSVVCQ